MSMCTCLSASGLVWIAYVGAPMQCSGDKDHHAHCGPYPLASPQQPHVLTPPAHAHAITHAGVDIASLLAKIGLQVNDTNEKVGTFAIAYAAHKALSPVRFPPTVALTPVVASWLKKGKQEGAEEKKEQ